MTVNSVTRTGPTTATINVSTVNATPGLKAITVVNPDGQSATSGAILRVTPGPFVAIDSPVPGSVGQPVTVRGWAVDGTRDRAVPASTRCTSTPRRQGGAAMFLGAATYGQSRPDIGAAHGARFTQLGVHA